MENTKKTTFSDFLKNLYWQKSNIPEIKPGFFGEKYYQTKRSDSSFKKVVEKLENEDREKDFDDFSAFLWKENFNKEKINQKNRSKDYLNQEVNPHTHIDVLTETTKKQININVFSPLVVVVATFLLAILLTAGTIRLNPGLAKKMVDKTDFLIIKPMKISYCAITKDIYFCGEETNRHNVVKEKEVDKNILSSYIVNNSDRLKSVSADASLMIDPQELDGRVAGVSESAQSEASEELESLFKKNENKLKKLPEILNKAIRAQKDFILKAQNKLVEIIF